MTKRRGFYVNLAEVPAELLGTYRQKNYKWRVVDSLWLFARAGRAIERGYSRDEHERRDILLLLAIIHDALEAPAPAYLPAPIKAPRPAPKRRHRKLGPNVTDLAARRRELQDGRT